MSACQPTCPPNCITLFANQPQTYVVACKSGVPFSWTVPYGTLRRLSQAQADFDAYNLAKQQATTRKICFITTELPVGRVGELYSDASGQPVQIRASGGTPFIYPFFGQIVDNPTECIFADNEPSPGTPVPYHYEVIDGALPDGLSFDCFGFLKGIPHSDGNFVFTVRINDAVGSFQRQQFEIVVGCLNDPIKYRDGGYLYFQIPSGNAPTPGWQTMAFDDRAWRAGAAAFGQRGSSNCPLQGTVVTTWNAGTDLLIRKKINLGATLGLALRAAVDNDIVEVWFNDEKVSDLFKHDFCPHYDDFKLDLPPGKIGPNLIAVRVRDNGDESFFDMRMEVACP